MLELLALQIKYYKGLGTSNTDEAREYFSQIKMHRKEFAWQGAPSISIAAFLPPAFSLLLRSFLCLNTH